jgi:hypothetical protein
LQPDFEQALYSYPVLHAYRVHSPYGTVLDPRQKKIIMKSFIVLICFILSLTCACITVSAQKKKILVDVAHGQRFYSDPADRISTELVPTDRLNYMTGELKKNAAAHNAELAYLKTPITAEALSKSNLLFIHVPSKKYSADECKTIRQFVENGGSLFIVVEEDYWSTLAQVNANDIVTPFGITFASNNPDRSSGGHSEPGKVTNKKYSIPYHGARTVKGGKPFAYSNASDANAFGVFAEVKGRGKVIAMGEGMVSLYMTSWQDVNDYQCAPFMEEAIGWLLE